MQKTFHADKLTTLFLSKIATRSGVEHVVFRQVYAFFLREFRHVSLPDILMVVLVRLQQPSVAKRAKRALVFLMKVLVSGRVGICIPDYEVNSFDRWVEWGSQIACWLKKSGYGTV